ncbi:MAG: 2,3-bisphosphoglycerate-independent phosphoglycerate mutase [bacterium ADurb.Bin400]|nr:MAG: 2,3-bisphosphoglycerate-independent phosphoglycerate mutase [bacterium ADurb.Bin400]
MLVKGEGNCFESSRAAFTSSYSVGTTDEFIEPRFIASKTQQKVTVEDNDAVIIFNFRSDRVKELIRAFLDEKIEAFPDRKRLNNLYLASFVIYDDHLLSKQVFSPEMVEEPIGKVWSEHGLKQFHIAETEKYPHVTYFINGGVEKPYSGEDRLMIPSPRNTKTYDYIPQMSAEKITSSLIKAIKSNLYDRFIVNYANPDMVGHTGNLSATVQAVECVDTCLGRLLGEITEKNGLAFITADHGNAEQMVNPATGEAHTEHTTNPVPFIIVGNQSELKNIKLESNGILASITPTILDMTNMAKPSQMRNSSLIIRDNIRGNNAAG